MKGKTYIAVLLTFIFVAKLVTIDGNGLNLLFSESAISFVKPHCKKDKLRKAAEKSASYSHANELTSQVISLNGFCTSQFQLEPFSWETALSEPIATSSEHTPGAFSYLLIDNASPPPRIS